MTDEEKQKIIEKYRPGGSRQFAISLDPELFAIFQQRTKETGITVRYAIEEGMRKWLKTHQ